MENHFKKLLNRLSLPLIVMVVWSSLFVSCKDDYPYDNEEPEWLGESIYDYLKTNGNYTYFVQIIDDVGYTEVLAKTGSKTLFVSDDDAFERFFNEGNAWGVTSFEKMSLAQKKLILNFSMVNNAYLIETLSNYFDVTLQEGSAIRRVTTVSVLDSVAFEFGSMLPSSSYWDSRRSKGIHLLKDNTRWPLVHFQQKVLDYNGISNEDFKIMTGIDRQDNDAHIFGNKVIERDITCKNGYVDVLENVLIPPTNIATYIRNKPKLLKFAELLDRFCAPFYDATYTAQYRQMHTEFTDSIFTLKYFAKSSILGGTQTYPSGAAVPTELQLPYDPGCNSYTYRYGSLQSDMAAIFAPTNEALENYFNEGSGRALKERYGSWAKVPNDILALLLTRHMRTSLVNSLPSNFYKMVDESSSEIGVKKSDIIDSLNYIGLNGIVYVTNKIYPPNDFVSVYGPALFSKKTTVINWAIRKYLYHLYLNSMVNSYAFLAPTDQALKFYIDPLTYGTNTPTVLKFWYDQRALAVKASVFNYDKTTGLIGDSVTLIDNTEFVKSRLVRILDQSIIVGDFKNNSRKYSDGYYVTKDGNIIKTSNITDVEDKQESTVAKFQGGDDIVKGNFVSIADSGIYHQLNGTTFFLNSICQTPFISVWKVLSETPEFEAFYNLCKDFPNSNVFVKATNYFGIDFNIKFFNTFRYTVYVPTNQAIQDALNARIIYSWEEINKITDLTVQNAAIKKMERFIRYHFQDNSVFIHPSQSVNQLYQTATIKENDNETYLNTYKNKFYRLKVESNGTGLNLTTETGETAAVDKSKGLYNIMTKDYVFSINPASLTSLTTTAYSASVITTSSTAVIHQIDKVLRFE